MLTDDEIDAMRAAVAAALPSTCTITRPGGEPIFNPATGGYTPAEPIEVYTGACRVHTLNTQDMQVQIGDLAEGVARYIVTLPYDATGVARDDFVVVNSGTDPDLEGRPLRVLVPNYGDWNFARRLVVEDRQG